MGSSPEGTIGIRRAEPGDYEGFAYVFEGASAQAQTLQMPFPSRETWRQRLAESPLGNHLLVALVDGKIVANGGLHPAHHSPRRAHAANLGLSVHDDYQGKGVGKAMLQALLELADGWTPYTRLELSVYADNARAIALYKHFGFEPEGLMKSHTLRDGQYVDTVAMARLRPRR